MRERVLLLSRRMSNFHDPLITMHHSGIFAQKNDEARRKEKPLRRNYNSRVRRIVNQFMD